MRVGDVDWAIQRQAELYAEEFRYSAVFETYVVQSFVPFLDEFDAKRDQLWIAEIDGSRVGCIALQHDSTRKGWAKLRWYFVERFARGHGVGKALMDTLLSFARKAAYEGIWLWTVDDLHAARRHYEKVGFTLAHTETEPCAWAPWGHEQRWEMKLI